MHHSIFSSKYFPLELIFLSTPFSILCGYRSASPGCVWQNNAQMDTIVHIYSAPCFRSASTVLATSSSTTISNIFYRQRQHELPLGLHLSSFHWKQYRSLMLWKILEVVPYTYVDGKIFYVWMVMLMIDKMSW